jgi:undecaprenyl-diphosphatase
MTEWLHLLKAFFLGIIEGLTEFLPISSTGHLILVGAILAVCWLYRAKIMGLAKGVLTGDAIARRFALIVLLAFLPAALIGGLFVGPSNTCYSARRLLRAHSLWAV